MKKLLLILLGVFSLVSVCSCTKAPDQEIPDEGKPEKEENKEETPDYKEATGRILVVYYSYTGNCKDIVSSMTGLLKADVMEIKPAVDGQDYAANNYKLGADLINAIQAKPGEASSYPGIKGVDRNAGDYDTIIIVTPLWHSHMAAIMQAYLFKEGTKMKDKNVGLIVSSASSGISSVVADAKRLVPSGKFLSEALWVNNSNRSKQGDLLKEWTTKMNLTDAAMAKLRIINGEKSLTATFEDNSSATAFIDKLRSGNVTVKMQDYGNFEKVGSLGFDLPRNDTQITTIPGDVILYQGNQITIYYDENSWSFTKLAHVDGATKESMKSFLGDGDVSITFSLTE